MELFQKPTSPKTLRPHQKKAVQMIIDSMRRGNRRVVCQMPTGAGKTVTAAKMIISTLKKGNRCIFTAPAISLIDQTVAAFEEEGIPDIGVMQATHPRDQPERGGSGCLGPDVGAAGHSRRRHRHCGRMSYSIRGHR